MTEGFLESRGIAYRTNNFRDGRPTLVFVHGLSGACSAWYPFEKIFEEKYNLLTFDLRGHGLSMRPARAGYSMGEFVEDIRALFAHLNIERCAIVSHSFGTLIAMEFARAFPALAERNIFLAPAYGVQHFKISKVLADLGAALAMAPFYSPRGRRTNYARFYPTPDWSVWRIGTDIRSMGIRSYLRGMKIIFAEDYTRDWSEITGPVLIIHGAKDSIVPVKHAHALARALPQATLTVLPDANHILPLNNVGDVSRAIEDFIK